MRFITKWPLATAANKLSIWFFLGFCTLAFSGTQATAFSIGDRIIALSNATGPGAETGGANVRDSSLASVLFEQFGGVHGTVVNETTGSAGGFTGNWYKINWDSEPPSQNNIQGWSAESVLRAAPTSGDIGQPNFFASAYISNNPFFPNFAPDSIGGSIGALGNCTWYAFGRMLEMGYDRSKLLAFALGNASTWWNNAANVSGVSRNSTPSVGDIAWLDSGSFSSLGHVAVVESINGDGTVTVTESSYSTVQTNRQNFLWRHRTVNPTWFSGFIHVAKPGDTAAPTVTAFDVAPLSIAVGQSLKISYTVSDSGGSGLDHVVLRRTSGDGSTNDPGWKDTGDPKSLLGLGNGPSSDSFNDTPPSAGTYWYGLAVFDGAGNSQNERQAGLGPTQVTVNPPDTTAPNINSFSVSPTTVSLGQSITVNYTVSDAGGSGLASVVLRRTSGDGSNDDPGWQDVGNPKQITGNDNSGSFSDFPPATGIYWYGVAVFDKAGNSKNERQAGVGPLSVTVNQAKYTISVSASPSAGGSVSGGGTFGAGSSRTVSATANTAQGYKFVKWTEGGNLVSSQADYTFTLSSSRVLVANFAKQYTIALTASPLAGGSVIGAGTFDGGSSRTVTAIPNTADGYKFKNWNEAGNNVSISCVCTAPDDDFAICTDAANVAPRFVAW